jgi:hypothetical protein
VFNDGAKSQVALFGEDIRRAGDTEAVGVRLGEVQLKHLWQWDAWWVSCVRWLKYQLKRAAPGLTPRTALEKFKIMQMVDVHLPTTDGRHLILSRYNRNPNTTRCLISCASNCLRSHRRKSPPGHRQSPLRKSARELRIVKVGLTPGLREFADHAREMRLHRRARSGRVARHDGRKDALMVFL